MVLDIWEPVTLNPLDSYIANLPYITNNYKSKYVNLVNNWISLHQQKSKYKIEQIMANHNNNIILGKFYMNYLKTSTAPTLTFDDFGIPIFDWREE